MSSTAPEPLIRARGLTKRFGTFTAVDGIDFDVAPGEAFGFFGPNGGLLGLAVVARRIDRLLLK
jgi:lipooligosaccharide transport system ATP-binding protein